MCNLYRMTAAITEVANMFGANPLMGANVPAEIYPGYPGVVVAGGQLRTMTWGFPLILKGKQGQPLKPRPVNNAREDKLHSPFWRDSFDRRRCLIPVSAWAEAEGEKGRMTRTWYALPGDDLFAVAGLWRPTLEWGDTYAMVMVDGCEQMSDVHDRMPVILPRESWHAWTDSPQEAALGLCKIWAGDLLVNRTPERWAGKKDELIESGPVTLF